MPIGALFGVNVKEMPVFVSRQCRIMLCDARFAALTSNSLPIVIQQLFKSNI